MTTTRRELLFTTGALAGASVLHTQGAPSTAIQGSQQISQEVAKALNIWDFESMAERILPPSTWGYIQGAAADEISFGWNRSAFDQIRLRPRYLVDHSRLDTRISLFGQEMSHPILLAPTGSHRSSHPEGELATARGAGRAGATMVVSTYATTAVEDIATVATRPLWFQLYFMRDRAFNRDLIARAQDAGCQALVVTLDSPIQGPRNRQVRAGHRLPPGVRQPHVRTLQGVEQVERKIFSSTKDPTFSWKDLDWLRSVSRIPILLKGVLDAGDAEKTVQAGADGLIVSNHGARNLDTVPASIDALPEVAEQVGGRIPILMDSGIRRGTDVLKALALGASAVLVGRPYVYGLASAGAEGVHRVLQILQTELEMSMVLTGKVSIDQIDRSVLWKSP